MRRDRRGADGRDTHGEHPRAAPRGLRRQRAAALTALTRAWDALRVWSPRATVPGPAPGGLLCDIHGVSLTGAARERALALAERHDLGTLLAVCGPTERAESLYALDLLDQYGLTATGDTTARGRGLEVGAKSGAMLPGLAAGWPGGWDGVELDAHRRYWDLRTRRARGEAIAGALQGCRFHACDVRALPARAEGWARIAWFLPFVTPAPHAAWGLPPATFAPEAVLADVLGRLAPGGRLLIVNQGDAEHAEQGHLLERGVRRADDATPLEVIDLGVVTSHLSPYTRPRMGWQVTRCVPPRPPGAPPPA